MPASTPALEPFTRRRTALLATFRRDGSRVETPVTIAVEGDHAHRQPILQGVLVPLAHRVMRYRTVHYELRPIR